MAEEKKQLSLSGKTLELKNKTLSLNTHVRQNTGTGKSNVVQVEVRKKRVITSEQPSNVLSSEATQQTTTAKVAHKPTENEWFEVKPRAIDQKLFENKRKDDKQEATRLLILEAFAEMKKNPEISWLAWQRKRLRSGWRLRWFSLPLPWEICGKILWYPMNRTR